ncbi:hypothetical protein Q8F55_003092 [Vanrija albida]|uniref:Uncharacterized protein n=1 Tax=Vanrija albida TaxID=181172 RepID=A0ABR3QBK7_9TREE
MIRGLSVAQFISRPRLAHILAVGAVLAVLSVVHLGLLAEVQSPSPVDGARPTGWWSKVNLPGLRPSSHGKFQGHGQEWQWDGAATDMYDGYNGDGHGFIYRNKHNDGPCAGWDRHGLKEDDPPGCLRARQWRELQHFRALEGSGAFEKKLQDHNQLALDRVERCVLGFLDCPDRPLIVSTYGYMNMRLDTSGEAIWLYPVMKAAEEMRFNFITLHMEEGWNVTQLLPSVVHSLWQNSVDTFKCQTNPLCIRPEDYVPAEDERFRHDLSLVPKSRMGNLPPWRMFTVDFWGARASGYGAPGINVEGQWGITKDVKDWSPHLLGNKFQFVPYPYPGHTHIPISIEQRCLHAEYVPYERRNQSALVLAKRNRLFHDDHNKPIEDKWPQIAGGLKDIGYDLLAVATMEDKDEENKKKYPIPPELNNLGRLTSDGYSRLVSNQRALLGIGKPEISPSPYVAV